MVHTWSVVVVQVAALQLSRLAQVVHTRSCSLVQAVLSWLPGPHVAAQATQLLPLRKKPSSQVLHSGSPAVVQVSATQWSMAVQVRHRRSWLEAQATLS
jgi:hypothetical protein